jgi:hypothetical protein
MDVWRIEYNMLRSHQVLTGTFDSGTFLSYHRG